MLEDVFNSVFYTVVSMADVFIMMTNTHMQKFSVEPVLTKSYCFIPQPILSDQSRDRVDLTF